MTIASSKCPATLGRAGIYCIKGRIFRLDPLRKSFVFERLCPCETCVKATHHEKRIKKIASLMLRSDRDDKGPESKGVTKIRDCKNPCDAITAGAIWKEMAASN